MPSVSDIKAAVRIRDNYQCVVCGMTRDQHRARYGKTLDVHRKLPGSVYTVDGCITICRKCHGTQPRRKRGQPDFGNPRYAVAARIDPAIGEALDRYVDNLDPRPPFSRVVQSAIREFLRAKGFWPPPDPKE